MLSYAQTKKCFISLTLQLNALKFFSLNTEREKKSQFFLTFQKKLIENVRIKRKALRAIK
jgi:hypothetical protein